MKEVIKLEDGSNLTYEESFWTSKKNIYIDNVETKKISKVEFKYGENLEKTILIKGNFLKGVQVVVDEKEYEVSPKTTWYQYIIFILPIVFIITWGAVPQLVAIFPVVGGAIGGFISALFSVFGLILGKKIKNKAISVGAQIAFSILAILICYFIGLAIIGAAASM